MSDMREKFAQLDLAINELKDQPGALMPVLQKAQSIFGCVSLDVQKHIAEGLGVTLSEVYGVATFYAQFTLEPAGKYVISVCLGTACYIKGSGKIYQLLQEKLGVEDGGCTEDGLFTLEHVACLGCCSLAPVIMINGEAYGNLTPEKAIAILKDIREKEGK